MSLLITAFNAFDGGWNCSDRLLDALRADSDRLQAEWGGRVAFARFAVDAETIGDQLDAALAEYGPTHLLLTGQATGRAALALERTARNLRDLRIPDTAGREGVLGPVRAGGPTSLTATWPDLAGAVAMLAGEGMPAYVSDDAGTHLCNQTLYLALERSGLRVTFLHLPLLPEQVAEALPAAMRRPGCATLPLEQMARAVRLVLRHTRSLAAA